MKAKKTSTTAQKIECIYRRQIRLEKQFCRLNLVLNSETLAMWAAVHGKLIESNKVLADHVARVLREKETLVKMIGTQEIQRQLEERKSTGDR
jgi:hypothetical protein